MQHGWRPANRKTRQLSAKRCGRQNELREIDTEIANLMTVLEEGSGDMRLVLDQLQRRTAERELLKARWTATRRRSRR